MLCDHKATYSERKVSKGSWQAMVGRRRSMMGRDRSVMGIGRSMMGRDRSMMGRDRSMMGRGRSHQQAEAMRPETEQWISVRGGMDTPWESATSSRHKGPRGLTQIRCYPLWGLPSPTPIPGVHWVSWSLAISPVTLGGTRHGFILLTTKAASLQSARGAPEWCP